MFEVISRNYASGINVDKTTADDGDTIEFVYVDQTLADNSTVAYTISGVTPAVIDGQSLTGNFTVVGGIAYLTITATNGPLDRTLTFSVNSDSVQITLNKLDTSTYCDFLVVAGGGAGSNHSTTNANGGGGGGGLLYATNVLLSGNYTVVVGAGGSAVANSTAGHGNKGQNSSLGDFIAQGGGGGVSSGVAYSSVINDGGSGGGHGYPNGGGGGPGQATQTNIGVATGYGNRGGNTSVTWTGAGGGGAGAVGVAGSGSNPGGNGGAGLSFNISGTTKWYAGGGGGSGNSSERAGDGFHGGGRGAGTTTYYAYNSYPAGQINSTTLGSSTPTAIINTGGGGGAGSYWAANGGWSTGSGQGGSGIVIVRYAGPQVATGGTVTTVGDDTIHTFISSGTFQAPPPSPTYQSGINVSTISAYNGDTIDFTYVDLSIADNSTVAYTITGVNSADINGASLTGNFTVVGGIAYLTITATNLLDKTLIFTANNESVIVTLEYAVNTRYLVVAGGGGGGMDMGGGGGAGGLLRSSAQRLSPGSYNVVVGAGGTGAPTAGTGAGTQGRTSHQYTIPATAGQDSQFLGLTAVGGGIGGSSYYPYTPGAAGGNGGSGGGASGYSDGGTRLGGTGVAGQGFRGGGGGGQYYSGGGGGAGGQGIDSTARSDGGPGLFDDILGTAYYWAGGGGGSGYSIQGGNGGIGGGGGGAVGTTTGGAGLNNGQAGGGGSTASQTNKPGGNGGANTGGGGGGGSHYTATNQGGNGGSGIVVVRYSGLQKAIGGTVTTVSTDTVHTFTSSGTLTIIPGEGLATSISSGFFGDTFTVYFSANEADNTTIPYTITGVTSADINNASLTGDFTITNGIATLEIVTVAGTLDNKTFSISAYGYTATVALTYLVSMTAPSIAGWGADIIVSIVTENLAPGATVPYTITGVTTDELLGASFTGNITIASGTDPITSTLTIDTDPTMLTTKTLTVSIPGGYSTSTGVTFISVPRNIILLTAASGTPAVVSTTLSDLKESQIVSNQWDYSQIIPTFLTPAGGPLKISPTDPGDLAEQVSVATSPQGHSSEQNLEQVNMVGTRSSPTYVYSDGAPVAAPAPGEQLIQIWYIT
jgi:hypothetical protein